MPGHLRTPRCPASQQCVRSPARGAARCPAIWGLHVVLRVNNAFAHLHEVRRGARPSGDPPLSCESTMRSLTCTRCGAVPGHLGTPRCPVSQQCVRSPARGAARCPAIWGLHVVLRVNNAFAHLHEVRRDARPSGDSTLSCESTMRSLTCTRCGAVPGHLGTPRCPASQQCVRSPARGAARCPAIWGLHVVL